MVGMKWTTASNLLIYTQEPSPYESVDTLDSATALIATPVPIKDIIPNTRWSCMVLPNIHSGKTPNSPAHSSGILDWELISANPEYNDLTIRQLPSWLCNPELLKDSQLLLVNLAFKDLDGSLVC